MKRRKALKAVAGIITGAGLSTGVSAEHEPEQIVHLVPEPHDISHSVEPNTPVTHRFGWRTVEDEGPDVLREVLEATSYQAYFNGEPLSHEPHHWGPIQPKEDPQFLDQWVIEWKFRVPAVTSGTHEFKVIVNYIQPYTGKKRGGYEKTRSGTDILTAQYTVPQT